MATAESSELSGNNNNTNSSSNSNKKEIYTHEAPFTVYAMAWCRRPGEKFRMAIGSYKEEYSNQVHIIQLNRDEQGNSSFSKLCEVEHPYPATKVMFAPEGRVHGSKDLLATTGDYLRLWNIDSESEHRVEMKAILNNNKHTGSYIIHRFKLTFVMLSLI
jgi:WD repeat-containing protein 68